MVAEQKTNLVSSKRRNSSPKNWRNAWSIEREWVSSWAISRLIFRRYSWHFSHRPLRMLDNPETNRKAIRGLFKKRVKRLPRWDWSCKAFGYAVGESKQTNGCPNKFVKFRDLGNLEFFFSCRRIYYFPLSVHSCVFFLFLFIAPDPDYHAQPCMQHYWMNPQW